MRTLVLIMISVLALILPVQSKTIRAYYTHAEFNSPEEGPYIEAYLSIDGRSIIYAQEAENVFMAKVEVTVTLSLNNEIKAFKKYEIKSRGIADTSKVDFDLFDQQRFPLPSGKYEMEISIKDVNSPAEALKASDVWELPGFTGIEFSGIEAVLHHEKADQDNEMTKSGMLLIPHQDNFFASNDSVLNYYTELYFDEKSLPATGSLVVMTGIYARGSQEPYAGLARYIKVTAGRVIPLMASFDLSKLATGNYLLVLQAKDRTNATLATASYAFARHNPSIKFDEHNLADINFENTFVDAMGQEELIANIKSLDPIADPLEKSFIKSLKSGSKNENTLKEFMYSFWQKRSISNPSEAWSKYYNQVVAVEKEFGNQSWHGYETDRGRVYLAYGPPDQRIMNVMNDANYPYETWQYYKLHDQSNVRFVFYSRGASVNMYTLVHSTLIGEVSDPLWQEAISQGWHDLRSKDWDSKLNDNYPLKTGTFHDRSDIDFDFLR